MLREGRSWLLKSLRKAVQAPRMPIRAWTSTSMHRHFASMPNAQPKEAEHEEVKLTINGKECKTAKHTTVLEACRQAGFYVPTLCNHPRLPVRGTCRICLVDVGSSRLMPACVTEVAENMKVQTDTPEVLSSIKSNLSLLLAAHPNACMTCEVNGQCEFQDLIARYQVHDMFPKHISHEWDDHSSTAIERAMDKCVKCGRCVSACSLVQGMNVLGMVGRGEHDVSRTVYDAPLDFTQCIECGQCASFCPTGAITERNEVKEVLESLSSRRKINIAQTAPACRVAVGEEMGIDLEPGQFVAGLRELGFDYVFDTNFTADLTIMEEGSELIERVKSGGPFPMFTSCCPAWVTLVEKVYPEYIPNLSTCRSPQQMLGSLVKNYFAKKIGKDPQDIVLTSIMPCTAKKSEAKREEFSKDGVSDVDHVLTTREIGRIFRLKHVPLSKLPEKKYDNPMGDATGAGMLFGATGGVMEAAVRTAYELLAKKPLPKLVFEDVRGLKGIKKTSIEIPIPGGKPVTLNLAVVSGTANARHFLKEIKSGTQNFHFVEVMACPGGCLGGGGQPKSQDKDILAKRMKKVYKLDEMNVIWKSHENPSVQALYRDFLGKPLSEKSHHLLHTNYHDRSVDCNLIRSDSLIDSLEKQSIAEEAAAAVRGARKPSE